MFVARKPVSPYDSIARLYDPWSVSVTEDVGFYVDLALEAGGPVVELGVGTGRIAVPTAAAGVRVIGVDSSRGCSRCAPRPRRPPASRTSSTYASATCSTRPVTSASGSSRARSARTSTCTRRRAAARARRRAGLLEPDGRLVFDVFAPGLDDIAETHGRWLEREPEIFERADWDTERRR